MKILIAFILSILTWLASVFGSNVQPRQPNDYAAPEPCATPIPLDGWCKTPPAEKIPYADLEPTPAPTDAMWRHYAP